MSNSGIAIETVSKLGVRITTTRSRWDFIVENKHRIMRGEEKEVEEALSSPVEIRRSIKDRNVFLYYNKCEKGYVCVVVRHLNGEGFMITAYITDKIKAGETIWKR